jgi:hypothetical protein
MKSNLLATDGPRQHPLKRDLRRILLTTAAFVVTVSAIGGMVVAVSEPGDRFVAFLGASLLFVGNTAFGCFLVVATYHFCSGFVRSRGAPGLLLRLGLAVGCVAVVAAGWFAVDLLLSGPRDPLRLFMVDYRGWVLFGAAASPVLVLIHERAR